MSRLLVSMVMKWGLPVQVMLTASNLQHGVRTVSFCPIDIRKLYEACQFFMVIYTCSLDHLYTQCHKSFLMDVKNALGCGELGQADRHQTLNVIICCVVIKYLTLNLSFSFFDLATSRSRSMLKSWNAVELSVDGRQSISCG